MNIVTEIEAWQSIKKQLSGQTIGFVPTMGNLHAGHISLCKKSCAENDITVVSLFVNPTQFNQPEDFQHYPRTLTDDANLLRQLPVDFLLHPSVNALYPDDYQIQITETKLSQELEGAYRPGHFNGMLTIVMKLLNLIGPTRAYFGEKDYQQWLLVKKMAAALFLPIDIIPCKTVRADDGLALSSRNSRLTPEQRQLAVNFPQLLQSPLDVTEVATQLNALGFRVDYIVEKWQRRLGAVWLGNVRLIDNIAIR